jgi:hypothetical protein
MHDRAPQIGFKSGLGWAQIFHISLLRTTKTYGRIRQAEANRIEMNAGVPSFAYTGCHE